MKKIITVFDGDHFSDAAIKFIDQYPSQKKPLLVGVFLSSVDYSNELGYSISMAGTISHVIDDVEKVHKNIKKFKSLCEQYNIDYKVHNDTGEEALANLRKETVFADLLVISSEKFFAFPNEEQPGAHMKYIMQTTECPILLLPEHFEFPKNTIIAYDGGKASAYAAKQFSYIFPELRGNATRIVYASTKKEDIPELNLIEELGSRHFSDLTFHKLEFSPRKYFETWLIGRKDAILVAGSYARKDMLSIFHKNFIAEVIADHNIPVFIAHK